MSKDCVAAVAPEVTTGCGTQRTRLVGVAVHAHSSNAKILFQSPDDFRICQTVAASPAKPGELP